MENYMNAAGPSTSSGNEDKKVLVSEVNLENSGTFKRISGDQEEKPKKKTCVAVDKNNSRMRDPKVFGPFITSQFGLMFSLLKHLPWHELKNMSLVCKGWLDAVKAILKNRLDIYSMHWSVNCDGGCSVEEYIEKTVRTKIFAKPEVSLIFVSNSIQARRQRHRDVICQKLKQELRPPRCILWSDGIVGCCEPDLRTVEVEGRRKGFSAFLMSDLPGVAVRQFYLNSTEFLFKVPLAKMNSDDLFSYANIKAGDVVKCLFIFVKDYEWIERGIIQSFVTALQSRQEEEFALGGGVVDEIFTDCKADIGMAGFAFCGPNVKASSMILSSDVQTKEDFNTYMKMMTRHSVVCDKNVGFMFTCLGRGKHWYDSEENVESSIFHDHFPSTPLVGMFGNGEIGTSTFTGPPEENAKKGTYTHSYSTVVVHMGFNIS